jgi:hypothetical protein
MFDIKSITDTSSADVALKHPVTGALLGATITVAGPEHPTRKASEFAKQRKLRQSFQKTGKLELTDPADDELDAVDKLTSCTLGWSGITDAGVAVEYSSQAAARLYATEGLGWLREQLLAAMGERERFIKACAQS